MSGSAKAAIAALRSCRTRSGVGNDVIDVQGHVDATATIEDIRPDGESYWVTLKFPPTLAPYIVRKGSIAVNGISLTVAGVDDRHFDVQVIPYTWEHTTLSRSKQGELVNIECDILGKYVVRATELALRTPKPDTE